ncbi:hypothetical protein [Wolbachia endosymbiont of Pentidionis agamae]|uniref:hypothetical protein n=1 Tax=Wolbachia endosymbiont of Pentidionis agamae TaxID=3110435 RepID=UPI002FCFB29A
MRTAKELSNKYFKLYELINNNNCNINNAHERYIILKIKNNKEEMLDSLIIQRINSATIWIQTLIIREKIHSSFSRNPGEPYITKKTGVLIFPGYELFDVVTENNPHFSCLNNFVNNSTKGRTSCCIIRNFLFNTSIFYHNKMIYDNLQTITEDLNTTIQYIRNDNSSSSITPEAMSLTQPNLNITLSTINNTTTGINKVDSKQLGVMQPRQYSNSYSNNRKVTNASAIEEALGGGVIMLGIVGIIVALGIVCITVAFVIKLCNLHSSPTEQPNSRDSTPLTNLEAIESLTCQRTPQNKARLTHNFRSQDR